MYVSPRAWSMSVCTKSCMPVYFGWEVLCIDRLSSKIHVQLLELFFVRLLAIWQVMDRVIPKDSSWEDQLEQWNILDFIQLCGTVWGLFRKVVLACTRRVRQEYAVTMWASSSYQRSEADVASIQVQMFTVMASLSLPLLVLTCQNRNGTNRVYRTK